MDMKEPILAQHNKENISSNNYLTETLTSKKTTIRTSYVGVSKNNGTPKSSIKK